MATTRIIEGNQAFVELLNLSGGMTVALMGAGGKHTLMARLEGELKRARLPAILTSSTNLHRPARNRESQLMLVEAHGDWQVRVEEQLIEHGTAYLLQRDLGQGMLRGLSIDQLEPLRKRWPQAVIVVKTDGARKRSLKAPSANEPVVPSFADVCVLIAGLDCIGKPLNDHWVHRPERVAELTGLKFGEPITAAVVAQVVSHPQSYLSRLPSAARRILYLSKACGPPEHQNAEAIFRLIPPERFSELTMGDTPRGWIGIS